MFFRSFSRQREATNRRRHRAYRKYNFTVAMLVAIKSMIRQYSPKVIMPQFIEYSFKNNNIEILCNFERYSAALMVKVLNYEETSHKRKRLKKKGNKEEVRMVRILGQLIEPSDRAISSGISRVSRFALTWSGLRR